MFRVNNSVTGRTDGRTDAQTPSVILMTRLKSNKSNTSHKDFILPKIVDQGVSSDKLKIFGPC